MKFKTIFHDFHLYEFYTSKVFSGNKNLVFAYDTEKHVHRINKNFPKTKTK